MVSLWSFTNVGIIPRLTNSWHKLLSYCSDEARFVIIHAASNWYLYSKLDFKNSIILGIALHLKMWSVGGQSFTEISFLNAKRQR